MKRKRKCKSFLVRLQKIRAEKIERNLRRKRKLSKGKFGKNSWHYSLSQIRKDFLNYQHVWAPPCLSLVENETQALDFLAKLKQCLDKKRKVLVHLERVIRMTTDAIVVLLSNMVRFKSMHIDFNGTHPIDRGVRGVLIKSGFFKYLFNQYKDEENYEFNEKDSKIYTHGSKAVASSLADRLIESASKSLWGEPKRCQGAQKTLVELMHNTFDHASLQKGEKHWWLSVEHSKKEKCVTFSFIDFGMGIYNSLENKTTNDPLRKAWNKLKSLNPFAKSQVDLIKLILEGELHRSQSGDYYRGKGLAKIYELCKGNKISSLCIISNRAYINVEKDDYHTIKNEFQGTFISFKIKVNTVSLPWQI